MWFFGWGVLINLAVATATAVAAEAAALKLRGKAVRPILSDGTAALTGLLLGLALPPLAPWWIPCIGAAFAILVAKQLYGGLGYNPFNPAMVGYVVLIISFPLQMTLWSAPRGIDGEMLSLADTMGLVFAQLPPAGATLDAVTMATPLDSYKTQIGQNLTWSEIVTGPLFGRFAGHGWQSVNSGISARRAVAVATACHPLAHPAGDARGPVRHRAAVLHCGCRQLCLAAVPPVQRGDHARRVFHRHRPGFGSHDTARTPLLRRRHRRTGVPDPYLGRVSDGVAFAVLLMNMAAPTIDYYTQPRVFGHRDSEE